MVSSATTDLVASAGNTSLYRDNDKIRNPCDLAQSALSLPGGSDTYTRIVPHRLPTPWSYILKMLAYLRRVNGIFLVGLTNALSPHICTRGTLMTLHQYFAISESDIRNTFSFSSHPRGVCHPRQLSGSHNNHDGSQLQRHIAHTFPFGR
jgi:hypothetical protein